MTLDIANSVRNAMLDALETEIGTAPILKIRTGAPPGIELSDSGTVLANMTLPSDWLSAAVDGSKALSGTWQDPSADATGTAGHFRLYKSDGTTQVIEGTITAEGGGGDMELDDISIEAAQEFNILSFVLNAGN